MVRVLDRMAAQTHVALAREAETGSQGSSGILGSSRDRTSYAAPFAVCLLLEWPANHPIEADSQEAAER
jgi:hypothetical protein